MLIYRKLLVVLIATLLLGFEPTLMAEQKPVDEQKSAADKQKSAADKDKQKSAADKQKSAKDQQDNQSKNASKSKKEQKPTNIITTIKELVRKR